MATGEDSQTVLSPNGQVYTVPDGIAYQEILGGLDWPVRDTYLWEHFYDYVYQMFEWGNENNEWILPMLHGVSLQDIHDKYFTTNSFMAMTQAYFGAYGLTMTKPLSSFQIEQNAQLAINYIANLPFNDTNKDVYAFLLISA